MATVPVDFSCPPQHENVYLQLDREKWTLLCILLKKSTFGAQHSMRSIGFLEWSRFDLQILFRVDSYTNVVHLFVLLKTVERQESSEGTKTVLVSCESAH